MRHPPELERAGTSGHDLEVPAVLKRLVDKDLHRHHEC